MYGSYTSPFVRHCRIVLLQSNFEFDLIETTAEKSAKLSPIKKIPLLIDGSMTLTDSSSIIKYIREKSGQAYFPDIQDYELYNMTNTVLDACINLFLLVRIDGVALSDSNYLQRQQARVLSGLEALDSQLIVDSLPLTDGQLRLACFLEWGVFRKCIDISALTNLHKLVKLAQQDKHFLLTSIPL